MLIFKSYYIHTLPKQEIMHAFMQYIYTYIFNNKKIKKKNVMSQSECV